MASSTLVDDFDVVDRWDDTPIFNDYKELHNAHLRSPSTSMQAALRRKYPNMCLTTTVASNVPLLSFAAAGKATAELDTKNEGIERLREYIMGNANAGQPGQLSDYRSFAKYIYGFGDMYYIVYIMTLGVVTFQFILKEPSDGETHLSDSRDIDRLLRAVGDFNNDGNYLWVYDHYWTKSRELFDEVKHASWKDVILQEYMKRLLTDLTSNFFDNKKVYHDLGLPWKRGVIFHGPAGNGKTISIKAMMHTLMEHKPISIPSMYIKSAEYTYNISDIFSLARRIAPCLLVFEDIDTIVTEETRSYFFNEVDGLTSNDGIFMVASTNHLDKLDPGLSSRPSRFDRKYLFDLPNLHERTLYCQYWKHKLQDKPSIEFPNELCPAIARITEDFSFAYLKEAFVATLVVIASRRTDDPIDSTNTRSNLDRYELWREIKRQIALLRDELKPPAEDGGVKRLDAPAVASELPLRLAATASPTMLNGMSYGGCRYA